MSMEVETLELDTKTDLYQLLDIHGKCHPSFKNSISREKVVEMYKLMLLTRMWNDKALSLQRQGRMGTVPSLKGQEATSAGIAYALGKNDWFVPAFREAGTLFHLGIPLRDQYLFWGGDERGGKIPDPVKTTNISIIVGGHLPHAVGIAYAAKYRKEKSAVVCVMGDGATSEGDFHESLNLAAVWQVPVVFVIQNNGWAISTPLNRQTATATLAEKAGAYNMEGLRVDGNDVFAIYKTVKDYTDRARQQHKPVLIELITYRMDDHTTADDSSRYRTEQEVEEWREKDPIDRLRRHLQRDFSWTKLEEEKVIQLCTEQVEAAVKEYESFPKLDPRNMFKHMYAEMPWNLREQMQEMQAFYNLPEEK